MRLQALFLALILALLVLVQAADHSKHQHRFRSSLGAKAKAQAKVKAHAKHKTGASMLASLHHHQNPVLQDVALQANQGANNAALSSAAVNVANQVNTQVRDAQSTSPSVLVPGTQLGLGPNTNYLAHEMNPAIVGNHAAPAVSQVNPALASMALGQNPVLNGNGIYNNLGAAATLNANILQNAALQQSMMGNPLAAANTLAAAQLAANPLLNPLAAASLGNTFAASNLAAAAAMPNFAGVAPAVTNTIVEAQATDKNLQNGNIKLVQPPLKAFVQPPQLPFAYQEPKDDQFDPSLGGVMGRLNEMSRGLDNSLNRLASERCFSDYMTQLNILSLNLRITSGLVYNGTDIEDMLRNRIFVYTGPVNRFFPRGALLSYSQLRAMFDNLPGTYPSKANWLLTPSTDFEKALHFAKLLRTPDNSGVAVDPQNGIYMDEDVLTVIGDPTGAKFAEFFKKAYANNAVVECFASVVAGTLREVYPEITAPTVKPIYMDEMKYDWKRQTLFFNVFDLPLANMLQNQRLCFPEVNGVPSAREGMKSELARQLGRELRRFEQFIWGMWYCHTQLPSQGLLCPFTDLDDETNIFTCQPSLRDDTFMLQAVRKDVVSILSRWQPPPQVLSNPGRVQTYFTQCSGQPLEDRVPSKEPALPLPQYYPRIFFTQDQLENFYNYYWPQRFQFCDFPKKSCDPPMPSAPDDPDMPNRVQFIESFRPMRPTDLPPFWQVTAEAAKTPSINTIVSKPNPFQMLNTMMDYETAWQNWAYGTQETFNCLAVATKFEFAFRAHIRAPTPDRPWERRRFDRDINEPERLQCRRIPPAPLIKPTVPPGSASSSLPIY